MTESIAGRAAPVRVIGVDPNDKTGDWIAGIDPSKKPGGTGHGFSTWPGWF